MNEYFSCIKDLGSKETLLKKVVKKKSNKQGGGGELELQFQIDSRNVRLRFNSLKTDTFERKSTTDKKRKAPESTEDGASSKG
jgi:hypothetical protein